MKTVAVLALPSVIPFDLGIACDVFAHAMLADGSPGYRVRVCAETAHVDAGLFELRAPWRLDELERADIVIVPGVQDVEGGFPPAVLEALRRARERDALVASICSGAFVLAAAGVLDGLRATTHWFGTGALAQAFPAIRVEPDALFVDEGQVVTSAGCSAGLDMCLHLVRRDYGQAVASHSAKLAVAPLSREGGQSQFVGHRQPPAAGPVLGPVLDWMQANLHESMDIASLAARACMSPRTFARRFRDQLGDTPLQWLLRLRIDRARELLETTSSSIAQIAATTGFESAVAFRARFQRVLGLSPSAFRKRFATEAERAWRRPRPAEAAHSAAH